MSRIFLGDVNWCSDTNISHLSEIVWRPHGMPNLWLSLDLIWNPMCCNTFSVSWMWQLSTKSHVHIVEDRVLISKHRMHILLVAGFVVTVFQQLSLVNTGVDRRTVMASPFCRQHLLATGSWWCFVSVDFSAVVDEPLAPISYKCPPCSSESAELHHCADYSCCSTKNCTTPWFCRLYCITACSTLTLLIGHPAVT